MSELIAHSRNAAGREQPLLEHAGNVAALAARFAEPFGSARLAAWLGWWHDAGKVASDVQSYLRGEGPSRDHSSVGMLAAVEMCPPVAFNVAGHHGGLADADCLKARVERKRKETRVTDALATALTFLNGRAPAVSVADLPERVRTDPHAHELWLRVLHSALVDADCLDTEEHFEPGKHALRTREVDLGPLRDSLRASQEAMIAVSAGPVNEARAEVYRACLVAAKKPPGVYSLTVPTGGGKTRAAMAFALEHGVCHGLRRVVVALPYTSIIEQNADVYRKVFGDAAVLEHHSAVTARETPGEATEDELRARLAAENWDAPVIVTTTVQLLESLFANRNSRVRKVHRIARSVMILDEVQTLPPRLLAPTLDVLRRLVADFGVTVLLCTATPPALVARDGRDGFAGVTEIVADPEALFRRLVRVRYEVAEEPWTWERAAAEVATSPQALAIVNTKRDADALLTALQAGGASREADLYHLSTNLCGTHRRAVLSEVSRRLKAGALVHLVSTQVVEAGVDLDFPLVLRALGPLDRIVQAAGRCNREGRMDAGRVVVFRPVEGGMPPGEYRAGTQTAEAMLTENPALDFDRPATALAYFARLYDVLNLDTRRVQELRRALKFEQTARAYRLIDEETVAVAVRYGNADAVLDDIAQKGHASRADFRRLQPFLVNLRERAHTRAVAGGLCAEVAPGVWRWMGGYDTLRGLSMDVPILEDYVV